MEGTTNLDEDEDEDEDGAAVLLLLPLLPLPLRKTAALADNREDNGCCSCPCPLAAAAQPSGRRRRRLGLMLPTASKACEPSISARGGLVRARSVSQSANDSQSSTIDASMHRSFISFLGGLAAATLTLALGALPLHPGFAMQQPEAAAAWGGRG